MWIHPLFEFILHTDKLCETFEVFCGGAGIVWGKAGFPVLI
jgi:hypothetical protein